MTGDGTSGSGEGHPRTRRRRLTPQSLRERKGRDPPLALVTAYDYPTARLVEAAGMDAILVGDTLGEVVLGYSSTVSVTLEDILHHLRAVRRGAPRTLTIGDMPFLTFRLSETDTLRNAGRLMQEGNAHAVKLEGGQSTAPTARRLVEAGIPVMGHVGLTPQSVHQLGGYRVQGKTPEAARVLLDDALALEAAGCFSIVLEAIPVEVAAAITARLAIPTIGIAAGPTCDGQIQVQHDLLGLTRGRAKRHTEVYAPVADVIRDALAAYAADVRTKRFPTLEHSVAADDETVTSLAATEPSQRSP